MKRNTRSWRWSSCAHQGELGEFSANADAYIQQCQETEDNIASRKASQNCIEAFGALLPNDRRYADSRTIDDLVWRASCTGMPTSIMAYEFCMTGDGSGIALHGHSIYCYLRFHGAPGNAHGGADEAAQYSDFPTIPSVRVRMGRRTSRLNTHCSAGHANMPAAANVESAVAWKAALSATPGRRHWCFPPRVPHQARNAEHASVRRLRPEGLRRHRMPL